MLNKLRNWLIDPAVRNLDVNSPDITIAHREVVRNKRMLIKLFREFYRQCHEFDVKYFNEAAGQKRLEIGSGSSFIKDVYPDVITSDIKPLPFVDIVCDAAAIPFGDHELRAIYGINAFHHFPDPRAFFKEALRVLSPGGGIILIEPYHGALAKRFFPHLHESEYFDMNVTEWEYDPTGPMSNANQALSYIVFKRDRKIFEKEFPEFELLVSKPHTHLWYLLSGGVNFRQLVPNGLTNAIKVTEKLLSPLNKFIALQQTIVIRKRK